MMRFSRNVALGTLLSAATGCTFDWSTRSAPLDDAIATFEPVDRSGGGSPPSTGTGGVDRGGSVDEWCTPLLADAAVIVELSPEDDLGAALAAATAGSTLLLASGSYDVAAHDLVITVDRVSLMSAGGEVVLDAAGSSADAVITVSANDVTIAGITIADAPGWAVEVDPRSNDVIGTVLHGLHIVDAARGGIRIRARNGLYADDGVVACSTIELTENTGHQLDGSCTAAGVFAEKARGWRVRDNLISGLWCERNLAPAAVYFSRGSRGTRIERNHLVDNARGIGLGNDAEPGERSYNDQPCAGVSDASHYGGLIRNNMIAVSEPGVFASNSGMDTGIFMWNACGATVVHNTVASTGEPFTSIEWRYPSSDPLLINNLATHRLWPRNDAVASEARGNIEHAPADSFVDLRAGDAHLDPSAAAVGAGVFSLADRDIDGDLRSEPADVGADESNN